MKWSEGGNPDAARGETRPLSGDRSPEGCMESADPWFSDERD
jgi:hypothetical protein